jgi:hypothetical protein
VRPKVLAAFRRSRIHQNAGDCRSARVLRERGYHRTCVLGERGYGQVRVPGERGYGQVRVPGERGYGQVRVLGERGYTIAKSSPVADSLREWTCYDYLNGFEVCRPTGRSRRMGFHQINRNRK